LSDGDCAVNSGLVAVLERCIEARANSCKSPGSCQYVPKGTKLANGRTTTQPSCACGVWQ
jgi:hypothetical protein